MKQVAVAELMRWYLDAGVDETIADIAVDRFAEIPAKPRAENSQPDPAPAPAPVSGSDAVQSPASSPLPVSVGAEEAMHDAVHLAASAKTLEQLCKSLDEFEGCPLKKTATNLVFLDGNPQARILLIGSPPGADEDLAGIPFAGKQGDLFDRMLGSIGLDRTKVLMSGVVFWRPPGNRSPTPTEISVCMPFVERLIEIIDPHVLVAVGESSARLLLARKQAIGRMRGRWHTYSLPGLPRPVDLLAMNGPRVLMNSPVQKREAWQDLLMLREKIKDIPPD